MRRIYGARRELLLSGLRAEFGRWHVIVTSSSDDKLARAKALGVGGLTGHDGDISAWGLMKKGASAQTIYVGSNAAYLHMLAFMKSHHLHPLIERVFTLGEYEAALQLMAACQFTGKIVLTLQ